jgi:hypothetical protein
VGGFVAGPEEGVEVFVHGDGGYPCIRTPSIITTDTGTLLAFAGTRYVVWTIALLLRSCVADGVIS